MNFGDVLTRNSEIKFVHNITIQIVKRINNNFCNDKFIFLSNSYLQLIKAFEG